LAYFCTVWHILKHNLAYFVFVDLATLVQFTVDLVEKVDSA